jgi:hypothetical protein
LNSVPSQVFSRVIRSLSRYRYLEAAPRECKAANVDGDDPGDNPDA